MQTTNTNKQKQDNKQYNKTNKHTCQHLSFFNTQTINKQHKQSNQNNPWQQKQQSKQYTSTQANKQTRNKSKQIRKHIHKNKMHTNNKQNQTKTR